MSAGVGYLLHDVDRLHIRMACHCYESPTSTGLFGGYPSACNRRRFLKNANARHQVEAGRMPVDTSQIRGELVAFPAKMTRSIEFTQHDVYECGPSAGAGWGDPIEREAAAVADDVRTGAVSAAMARDVYGVVVGRDGAADAGATEARRAEIRKERLSWPVPKTMGNGPAADAKGEVLALAGDGATIQRVGNAAYFRCGCGHCIAPAGESWKPYARQSATTAAELGPRISLHAELEARRYACPKCARLHDVEIKLPGDEPLFDIEIEL
jgi:N-methylhydantoinase B